MTLGAGSLLTTRRLQHSNAGDLGRVTRFGHRPCFPQHLLQSGAGTHTGCSTGDWAKRLPGLSKVPSIWEPGPPGAQGCDLAALLGRAVWAVLSVALEAASNPGVAHEASGYFLVLQQVLGQTAAPSQTSLRAVELQALSQKQEPAL